MNTKTFNLDFHGRPLVAEFSDLTEQTNGSVILKCGDTTVMATVVMSEKQKENSDHFPLAVDYEEKFYAAGKILGSRFLRREGRPSEEAILNGRIIDRTIRPLFDKRIKNEIQVVATALSIDESTDPDALGVIAVSLALSCSDIPWNGPIGAVKIGRIDRKIIINPTFEEKTKSDIDLIICGKDGKINMIEGGMNQVPEEEVLEILDTSLPEIKSLVEFQEKIIKEIGKEKIWPPIKENPDGFEGLFAKIVSKKLEEIFAAPQKKMKQNTAIGDLKSEWVTAIIEKFGADCIGLADALFEKNLDKIMHKNIIEKDQRPDGRKMDEIRQLFTKTSIIPRAHGTGLFYRGLTHILSIATLGAPTDFLLIEGMEVRMKKRFMHHYNFPPYSVGEIGRLNGPGRREIGHGALAEKALLPIIPDKETFPYTIRVVSETMSSNGSSSMGSVCASTLALMDAGVPIAAPVSGIAMGLMMENEKKYKVLTDIQGPEDHHGDTDFKVAGTEKGLTALQMDVKIEGLPLHILKDILNQSHKARIEILSKIKEALPEPRKQISSFAPQIIIIKINPEKKGELIGPGGRTINKIIEETGVQQIDIQEDGNVFITGATAESIEKAKKLVEDITYEPQIGEKFNGTVVKITDFGAFVEIKTGCEGLVHISELAPFRVDQVSDIVKEGDVIPVKIINIDNLGRIKLSLKQADPDYANSKRKTR